jgi:hypothetical protein
MDKTCFGLFLPAHEHAQESQVEPDMEGSLDRVHIQL